MTKKAKKAVKPEKKKKEVRRFVLQEGGEDTNHIYTGKTPRAAALKATRRGHKKIRLREKGTRKEGKWKIHVFTGKTVKRSMEVVENAPQWMQDKAVDGTVEYDHPVVKKVGVERV